MENRYSVFLYFAAPTRSFMFNLAIILEDSAQRYPDKTAFVFGETRISYSQVNAAANQVANGLTEIGIEPGDKAGLSCLNIPYFPIIYFGILKAGAVVVPLSVLLKHNEIAYHLSDSDAKAYFCFEGTQELPMGQEGYTGFQDAPTCSHLFIITGDPQAVSPFEGISTLGAFMSNRPLEFDSIRTQENDTALIVYTSGTTGKPKGAELTHSNIFLNSLVSRDLLMMENRDILLIVLPLFHIFGQVVLMTTGVYQAVTSVLLARFDPETVFEVMQKEGVTVFAGVPTMYWGLLHCPDPEKFDLDQIAKNLRTCVSGGASLPRQVLDDFESKYNVPILEGYGMSEGSPVVTFNQRESRKPGSVGKPVWGVDVDLIDENDKSVPNGEKGELVYRGHNVMKGYYKRPEVNEEVLRGGWMHSGDVAIRDEEGYYFIVDRTKDMIIRGGLNVYPREVEEVMMKHPAVSLVAVIGIPDEKYGEEIKACVVLKEGESATASEIMSWTENEIAAYKYPRVVDIRDSLPMTATGKILKKELRAEVEAAKS